MINKNIRLQASRKKKKRRNNDNEQEIKGIVWEEETGSTLGTNKETISPGPS